MEHLIDKRVKITTPSGMVRRGTCLSIIKDKHIWVRYDNGMESGFTLSDGIKVEEDKEDGS